MADAFLRAWAPLLALAIGATAAMAAEPIVDCEPRGRARPICGFQSPDDLVALPGGYALLVSERGAAQGDRPGQLSLFVLASEERRVVFRGGANGAPAERWGDPGCPGPPSAAFTPHGIDLAEVPRRGLVLAVVQHGVRESIELFALRGAGIQWRVEWRGCVIAPPGSRLHDVVILTNGTLFATHTPRHQADGEAARALRDEPGYVLRWQERRGFNEVPATRGMLPIGIELSLDEKQLFVNFSQENQVRLIHRGRGEVEAGVAVAGPNHSTWAPDRRLLVASMSPHPSGHFDACLEIERGACPLPFRIIAIDPETLGTEVLYEGGGPPMGAGTVALRLGDELFVGSSVGDRLLRVQLAPTGSGPR